MFLTFWGKSIYYIEQAKQKWIFMFANDKTINMQKAKTLLKNIAIDILNKFHSEKTICHILYILFLMVCIVRSNPPF